MDLTDRGFHDRFQQLWLRQQQRNYRIDRMESALAGDFGVVLNDQKQQNLAVNMIHSSTSDIVAAASVVPSHRVESYSDTKKAKESAANMSAAISSILRVSNIEKTIKQWIWDQVAYGLFCGLVELHGDSECPRIEYRPAKSFLPEENWVPSETLKEAMFSRNVHYHSLPQRYKQLIDTNSGFNMERSSTTDVVLVDWVDETTTSLWAVAHSLTATTSNDYVSRYSRISNDALLRGGVVLLDSKEHGLGVCPIVAQQVNTFDEEPRGLHDQTIAAQRQYVMMNRMMMDHIQQMVYSTVYTKGLVRRQFHMGGGQVVELERDGEIGKVGPSSPSIGAFEVLDMAQRAVYEGARWSESRKGQLDQSQASAKYLEASAGTLNTLIREIHIDMADFLERALVTALRIDQYTAQSQGDLITSNQEQMEKYDSSMFDFRNVVTMEYALGFGRTPQETTVAAIQLLGNGIISRRTSIESIEGVPDADREEARQDVEKLEGLMFAQMAQMTQEGLIPPEAVPQMAEQRRKGVSISTLYTKYVVEPLQQQQAIQSQQQLLGPGGEPAGLAGQGPGTVPSLPPQEALAALPPGG